MVRSIKLPFVLVWEFLERTWAYLPILWRDRDWDFVFILRLLKLKLERTRKRIVKNDFISEAKMVGEEIRHAEILIERYLENDYCREELDAHEKKWGEHEMTFTPHSSGGNVVNIRAKNANTPEEIRRERQEIRAIYQEADRQKDQDWKELWAWLDAKMSRWWD